MATPEPIKKKPLGGLGSSSKPAVPSPLSRSFATSTAGTPNKRLNKNIVAPNPPKRDDGFNQLSFRHAALFPPSTKQPNANWPQGWERLTGLARPHLDGFDALDGKDGLLVKIGAGIETAVVFDGLGRGPASQQTGNEELGNKIECGLIFSFCLSVLIVSLAFCLLASLTQSRYQTSVLQTQLIPLRQNP
jgi:hypothetical protein